ncbi:MAG: hypothetical protein ACRBF0_09420 [Calditrichia bacterium]
MLEKKLRSTERITIYLSILLLSILLPQCDSTEPIGPEDVTIEDVIETLFLGTGRASAGGGCIEDIGGGHTEGIWRTFEKGSQIRLIIGSSVADEGRIALEREIAIFNDLIDGFFVITIDTSTSADPVAGTNEITSADFGGNQVSARCDGNSQGCAVPTVTNGAVFISVQTYQGPNFPGTSHVHEVGHALGLCHVSQTSVPGATMANPQLGSSDSFVEFERMAIERVFASGLEPGATTADFRQAGLIR